MPAKAPSETRFSRPADVAAEACEQATQAPQHRTCVPAAVRGIDRSAVPPRRPTPAPPTEQRARTKADALGLAHLRAFVAVVDAGTQSEAKRGLGTSQGSVARYLKRVDEHFGGGLFERARDGRLTLSTRGKLVEQSVRAALAELTRTRDRLDPSGPVLRLSPSGSGPHHRACCAAHRSATLAPRSRCRRSSNRAACSCIRSSTRWPSCRPWSSTGSTARCSSRR